LLWLGVTCVCTFQSNHYTTLAWWRLFTNTARMLFFIFLFHHENSKTIGTNEPTKENRQSILVVIIIIIIILVVIMTPSCKPSFHINLQRNLSMIKVAASQWKLSQVNTSWCSNKMQFQKLPFLFWTGLAHCIKICKFKIKFYFNIIFYCTILSYFFRRERQ
jgi:hypothetical protein